MPINSKFDEKNSTLNITIPVKFDESCFHDFKSAFEIRDVLVMPKIYQIDFSGTDDINSTGLLLILSLFHYAKEHNAKVKLINIKPQVKHILIENQYNEIVELS